MQYFILILLWIAFGALHSLMITPRLTTWLSKHIGKGYAFYRLFYNLFAILSFGWIFSYTRSLDSTWLIIFQPPWTYLRDLIIAGSILLIGIAFFTYDPFEFVGLRQIQHFISPYPPKSPPVQNIIVSNGLLGQVRHPMYLATILIMWSLDSTWADLLTHIILTLYIFVGIYFEEKKLITQYGQSYLEYKRSVPMLLPKLGTRI